IETDTEAYLVGIHTAEPVAENRSPEQMTKAVYDRVKKYLDKNKFVVTLGGEHSVSIGAIKAHAEHFEGITVVQIDAHADLRQEYMGSKYNHACVMARAKELAPVVQIGVRSMSVEERSAIDGRQVFYAQNILENKTWMYDMLNEVGKNVYLTIDLDALDPSIMPSTGTPEPGGLNWYQCVEIVKRISEKTNIVGLDVVELCPNPTNKAPDFLAAKLVYKALTYIFHEQLVAR
ncbi:MAG TPA: agmatinase, partial [Bacteroidales bacterium]|nr:agmatinase [Bacteroidales bacterium]